MISKSRIAPATVEFEIQAIAHFLLIDLEDLISG